MENHFKRYLASWLLVVLAISSWAFPAAAATNVVKLYSTPGSQSVAAGNDITLQIRLTKDTTSKVDFAGADIRFSANVLEVISVSRAGSYFTYDNGPTTSFNNANGTLTVSGRGDTLPTAADVLLASVTFRVKTGGTGTTSFTGASVAGDQLGSGNVKNSLNVTSGSTIVGVTPPPPSSTRTASPSQPTATSPAPSTPQSQSPTSTAAGVNEQTSPLSGDEILETDPAAKDVVTVDAKQAFPFGLELWQVLAASILTVGFVAVGIIMVMKRMHGHKLKQSDPEAVSVVTEGIEQELPNEHEFFAATPIPDPFANATETVAAKPLQQSSTAAQANSADHTVIEGVQIEPLDPSMPSPLTNAVQPSEAPQHQQNDSSWIQPSTVTNQPAVAPEITSENAASGQPETYVQPTQPQSAQPVDALSVAEEFPDMFEEGEARLRAEGLDSRLTSSKT